MKQQLEEEIKYLTGSFQQLKVAFSRFHESRSVVKSINEENKGAHAASHHCSSRARLSHGVCFQASASTYP